MGLPRSRAARDFYRCAVQRHEEARFLLRAGYAAGSVYLAGYTVECLLKSLVLDAVPEKSLTEILSAFRGNRGHDYAWLRELYLAKGGARCPPETTLHFSLVSRWSTELRYSPRTVDAGDADEFLTSVDEIRRWAEARF